ncbi:MAG: HNH endonuclease [Kaiparowitsia implicata GSE-PSE-MK54-09C]|jgi:5-methylcytosine-specific restriction endonuclease McrA|nr:HNH endonuclease [Kaiparowitsia implicata GSE-PSE-MK54-09C]
MTPKQKRAKKAQLISDYGLRCWWCDYCLPEEKLTLDHLKPKSRGGSNSLENLRLACFPCNNSRGNSLYPPKRLFTLNQSLINAVRGKCTNS